MPPFVLLLAALARTVASARLRRTGALAAVAFVGVGGVALTDEIGSAPGDSGLVADDVATLDLDTAANLLVAARFDARVVPAEVPGDVVTEDGGAAFTDRRSDRDPSGRVVAEDEPAWEERRGDLEDLLDALGHDYRTQVTDGDVERAARMLGVEIGSPPTAVDADALLHAHRQRASVSIRALGHDHGSVVVEEDVARAAEILDIEVDETPAPADVEAVIEAAATHVEAAEHGIRPNPSAKTPLFASAAGVALHVPSRNLALIGFHQSFGGTVQLQHFKNAPMRTLPSRARGTGSRTAVDISVEHRTPVLSPVTGRVVAVQRYALYGRYPDVLIHIVPDDNPRALVNVLHITGPRVEIGDRVRAGETVIAGRATKFPFASQIDRFAGPLPHVHIEVRGG